MKLKYLQLINSWKILYIYAPRYLLVNLELTLIYSQKIDSPKICHIPSYPRQNFHFYNFEFKSGYVRVKIIRYWLLTNISLLSDNDLNQILYLMVINKLFYTILLDIYYFIIIFIYKCYEIRGPEKAPAETEYCHEVTAHQVKYRNYS